MTAVYHSYNNAGTGCTAAGTKLRSSFVCEERRCKPSNGGQSAAPSGYPDGWNNLAYVNNNTMNCVDRLGLSIAGATGNKGPLTEEGRSTTRTYWDEEFVYREGSLYYYDVTYKIETVVKYSQYVEYYVADAYYLLSEAASGMRATNLWQWVNDVATGATPVTWGAGTLTIATGLGFITPIDMIMEAVSEGAEYFAKKKWIKETWTGNPIITYQTVREAHEE